jgi:predicted signal transduction protein with EAL and GGDEF domain
MGVAHLPTHAHTLDDLYQAADAALYATKRGGRAGVGLAPTPSR